jgi:hypothetical protein
MGASDVDWRKALKLFNDCNKGEKAKKFAREKGLKVIVYPDSDSDLDSYSDLDSDMDLVPTEEVEIQDPGRMAAIDSDSDLVPTEEVENQDPGCMAEDSQATDTNDGMGFTMQNGRLTRKQRYFV